MTNDVPIYDSLRYFLCQFEEESAIITSKILFSDKVQIVVCSTSSSPHLLILCHIRLYRPVMPGPILQNKTGEAFSHM